MTDIQNLGDSTYAHDNQRFDSVLIMGKLRNISRLGN